MDTEAAAVWSDPDAAALCLVALGLDRYTPRPTKHDPDPPSPVNWSPHTWADEVRDDCGVELHPAAGHRLHGGLALLHSPDEFYRSVAGFHTLAEALASDLFDSTASHALSAAEIAWAVVQAQMIHPHPAARPFAPAVVDYVARVCREDGFIGVPPVLRTFGLGSATDSGLPPALDAVPELAELVAESQKDLQKDLDAWLKDRLTRLADSVEKLPLTHSDPRPVAAELRKLAGG